MHGGGEQGGQLCDVAESVDVKDAASAAAVRPLREAKPCCIRLTIDSYIADISPHDWVARQYR